MEFELDSSESLLDATETNESTLILPVDIRLYTPLERFRHWLFGCRHVWSFPFASREIRYPQPYDTHQNCNKCGMTRFYRFKGVAMEAGPLFKKLINSESCHKESCHKERNY